MDDEAHTEFTQISDCFNSYSIPMEEDEVVVKKMDNEGVVEGADTMVQVAEAVEVSESTLPSSAPAVHTSDSVIQSSGSTIQALEAAPNSSQPDTAHDDIPPTPSAPMASTPSSPSSHIPKQSYLCRHNDHLCPVKRCTFCHIYTPPRAYHCRFCDVSVFHSSLIYSCVRNFDHHCPWVSNCVGLRNHKYFMWFLITSELSCLFGIGELAYFFTAIISAMFKEVFLLFLSHL